MPRKVTQDRILALTTKIQKLREDNPEITRHEICKKLKVSMSKYAYANGKIGKIKGTNGRKKVASVEVSTLPAVKAVRRDMTVLDLSDIQKRMPDLGRNTPAIVVMTDAFTAFSWMSSMMKGS